MPVASNHWRLNGRPVIIADYGSSPGEPTPTEAPSSFPSAQEGYTPAEACLPSQSRQVKKEKTAAGLICLRDHFPPAGSTFEGGQSDGYCFSLEFGASRAERNLEMIKAFLREHGYGDLPLPANIQELRAFRLPRKHRKQLQFFADNGYLHNPIKILFPPPGAKSSSLRLEIYNDQTDGHLLRFHGRA